MPELKKQKKGTRNKKTATKEGVVFESDPSIVDKVDAEDLAKEISSQLSYDPHFVTEKIIEFGKVLTAIPLYEYQYMAVYRVIYSIVSMEGATITMLFSRQSGKSEANAFIISTLTVIMPALAKLIPELEQFKNGIRIGLFAPQSDQVETTYNRALTRISTSHAAMIMSDPDIETELESEVRLELTNGSYLCGQTASKQSKIESKTYDLIFCEEAQDMDSFIIQKSITPMLTATNGTMVKSGTTGLVKNDFYHEIENNKRLSRRITDKRLVLHFQFDYKAVIKYKRAQYEKDGKLFHLNYEKFVEKEKRKRGEHNEVFKLSYALLWALDSGMFISDKEFDDMCNNKKGFNRNVEDDWHVVAGLDIAKDNASTILTVGRVIPSDREFDLPKKEIITWLELNGIDYDTQHDIIVDALLRFSVKVLYADYTGVGKPVVDRLTRELMDVVDIVPYTFSRPSKSDMWISLQTDIQSRRLIVPANKPARATAEFQNFEEQMKNLQKWYEGSYLVAEKSEGYYDDYCDSLALMVMAGNEGITEIIEMEEEVYNPFIDSNQMSKIHRARW